MQKNCNYLEKSFSKQVRRIIRYKTVKLSGQIGLQTSENFSVLLCTYILYVVYSIKVE
jgi:hypothetical protein